MYKRMLIPLDGSRLAEEVFVYAKELAGRLDVDLVFLHVCRPEESESSFMRKSYVERIADMVKRQAEEVQEKTGAPPKAKAIQAIGEIAIGQPAEQILRYTDENGIDLILMATHGRSG